jgi:hypothetical protein
LGWTIGANVRIDTRWAGVNAEIVFQRMAALRLPAIYHGQKWQKKRASLATAGALSNSIATS